MNYVLINYSTIWLSIGQYNFVIQNNTINIIAQIFKSHTRILKETTSFPPNTQTIKFVKTMHCGILCRKFRLSIRLRLSLICSTTFSIPVQLEFFTGKTSFRIVVFPIETGTRFIVFSVSFF